MSQHNQTHFIINRLNRLIQTPVIKWGGACLVMFAVCLLVGDVWAQNAPVKPNPGNPLSLPNLQLSLDGGSSDWVGALRILSILTLITMGPGIILTIFG